MSPTSADGTTIVEEISIKAPAERIFEALSNPEQRVKWWTSDYFKMTDMKSDLHVGGKWSMGGTGKDGNPFSMSGEYRVVDRPNALEFTWLAFWPPGAPESLVRFDLRENAGVTVVRLTHSGLTKEAASQFRGWPEILRLLRDFAEKSV